MEEITYVKEEPTTTMKNIKFYSEVIAEEDYKKIEYLAIKYTKAKNYFCSRYAGAKYLPYLAKYDKTIRDSLLLEYTKAHKYDECNQIIDENTGEIKGYRKCRYGNKNATKRNTTLETLGLQSRMWKQALSEAKSTISSEWSNARRKIRNAVFRNENLTEKDRHYIFCVLSKYHPERLSAVIQHKQFSFSKNEDGGTPDFSKLNTKYLNNLICRYVRKYIGKKPYSKKQRSFMLDIDMYSLNSEGINIMTCEKNKRVTLIIKNIKDLKKYKNLSSIRIVLDKENQKAEIHFCIPIEPKKNKGEKVIGLDKNYTNLFAISEGKEYGIDIGKVMTAYTEEVNEKTTKKNPYYAKVRKYKEELETCTDYNRQIYLMWKIKNIEENNLGTIKYNKRKKRVQAHIQNLINREIRKFIKEENPKIVILEDLTFKNSNKNQYRTKKYNRKMNTWCKGYLQERLEYILDIKGIQIIMVNPAYTSQQCHVCGGIGDRKYKDFYCPKCDKHFDADINASKNILQRYYDKDIKLYMRPSQVLEILKSRVK